jgi:hypothetical protein
MAETEAQGTGFASLEAVVIRVDGTVEDMGVVASKDPPEDPEPPDEGEE